jgi:hypothetical protein
MQVSGGPPKHAPLVATPEGLGIDIRKMAQFEQIALKMKLKRLQQLFDQNEQLEAEEFRLQASKRASVQIPPHSRILVKIIDERSHKTVIHKVSSSDGAAAVAGSLSKVIGRKANLAIQIEKGKRAELNDENLQREYERVWAAETSALVIIAV